MSRLENWIREFEFFHPSQRRRLLWIGLALVFFGTFLKVSWELYEGPKLESLDRALLVFIAGFRVPALNGPAVDITALGSATVLTFVVLTSVTLLLLDRDRRGALYLAMGSVGAGVGTFVIKHLFGRERPTVVPRLAEVGGSSYPSGHSLGATSIYLLLMFLTWRHFRSLRARAIILVLTGLLIGGVCFSRLYLGVHYPSDVLSGFLFGTAWTCLLTSAFHTRTE